MMDHSLITTTFNLDGYRVKKNLGLVRGITVRSRSLVGNIGAGIQILFEKARQEAYEILIRHAEEMGANAILGMRYDANDVASGVTEVLAYGTAVIVEKI
jgi:uncharacterized protein YbjQ (UPF0145 family)